MIYVIKGNEPYLIRKKIHDLLALNPLSQVTKFDGNDSDFNIDKVINTCQSINLFVEHNVVMVKDAPLLYKKSDEKEANILLEYAKNPTYESELIFYSLENNISEKLKVTKELIKNADFIKLDKLKKYDFSAYARNMVNQCKLNITKVAADYLINNANYDLSLLAKNLQVLSLYPEEINEKVIMGLISLPDEEDPFNLINAISTKNVAKSMEYINVLLKYDDNILGLISMISSQLRFLYAVSYYDSVGYTNNEIMDQLNIKNDFRLTKARESLRYISPTEIMKLLSDLSDLDFKCKTNSELDDKTKLELLIVKLLK